MRKNVIIVVVLFILTLFGFIFLPKREEAPLTSFSEKVVERSAPIQSQDIDKKATFAIYTNGTFRIFTASRYHNLSKDVFISSDSPNTIRIKKLDITWNDFFKTLPMSLTHDCLTTGTQQVFCTNQNSVLKFYLNGVIDDNLLGREIANGDRALITFGSENEQQVMKQIESLNMLSNN